MDLQTRKLNFIQDFIKLENEKSISHLEKLLQKETQNNSNLKLKNECGCGNDGL
jgi:hypothetical protein